MIYNTYKRQPKTNILTHINTYTYMTAKGSDFTGGAFSSTFELKEKINMC